MGAVKPGPKKRRKALSTDERRRNKLKADHIRSVRSVFRNAGFDRATEVAGVEIECGGQRGEFDDAFLLGNLLVLAEYTTTQSSGVTAHLKNKKILYSKIQLDNQKFIIYLREKIPSLAARMGDEFHEDKYVLRIVYFSRDDFDQSIKMIVDEVVYMDFPILKYFERLCSIVYKSSLPELIDFLGIDHQNIGTQGRIPTAHQVAKYEGSILPESSSGYPPGYKVVSFYVDAAALLDRCFVLRRHGWRGTAQAYQRMLQASKIEAIRKTLKSDKKVFVNNIIATLPEDTHPVDGDGKTIDIKSLKTVSPVSIHLAAKANSVGLIDGQHRLYSYYESLASDPVISRLRFNQNLLLTGIIYPPRTPQLEKEVFEANLFLSINSNQTAASSALKQEIEVVIRPYSAMAIGRQVIQRLSIMGPLAGHVEMNFYDKGKLKTSSIVSYGLSALLKLSGSDSIFRLFTHEEKSRISSENSPTALNEYVHFAASVINIFLSAVKANVENRRWTTDPSVRDRIISVTYINSFLITIRKLIESDSKLDFDTLKHQLDGIGDFDAGRYHSSQYARMSDEIFDTYFKQKPSTSEGT